MHVEIKQQRRAFNGIFEVGWAVLSGNRNQKRGPFAARGWRSGSRGRGDPDGREGLLKMKTAAPDGDGSASTDQAKAPGKEATGAFYGARRPWGTDGGRGAFGKRHKHYGMSGSSGPLRMRSSLYGAVRRPPPFILR